MLTIKSRPTLWLRNFIAKCVLCLAAANTTASEFASNVIVAADFSTSYYIETRFPDIEKNFEELSIAMTSRSSRLESPILFQVIPIDELSQAKKPLCKFTLQQRALIRANDRCERRRDCSDNPEELGDYLEQICAKTVIERGAVDATDIEGALSLAGQLASSQRADNKYLIIFSDMAEYRSDTVVSTPPDLSGFKVLVVCGSQHDQGSGFCMSQQATWSSKLKQFGAASVEFVIETSEWAGQAMDLFE